MEIPLRTPPRSLLVILMTLITQAAFAQSFIVDLGRHDPGQTHQIAVAPGEGVVEIVNRVPGKRYSVTTTLRQVSIPVLTPPGAVLISATAVCDDPPETVATARLANLTTEREVMAAVETLENDAATCSEEQRSGLDAEVRRLTVRTIHTFTVRAGQELEVVVKDDKQTWTVVFSTGARGTWRTMYGFVFTPNRDETYFAKAEGDKFRVTRQHVGDKEYAFIPSVFWSWMPTTWQSWWLVPSLTGGLGFDKSNPAVFLGSSFTYNENVGVVIGYVAQRQKRLNGNYDPANLPLIDTALTPDQLSREAYRPNLFFGVSFRFGSNPFESEAKKEPEKKEPAKEAPKP
jgi:hypothetical protein